MTGAKLNLVKLNYFLNYRILPSDIDGINKTSPSTLEQRLDTIISNIYTLALYKFNRVYFNNFMKKFYNNGTIITPSIKILLGTASLDWSSIEEFIRCLFYATLLNWKKGFNILVELFAEYISSWERLKNFGIHSFTKDEIKEIIQLLLNKAVDNYSDFEYDYKDLIKPYISDFEADNN